MDRRFVDGAKRDEVILIGSHGLAIQEPRLVDEEQLYAHKQAQHQQAQHQQAQHQQAQHQQAQHQQAQNQQAQHQQAQHQQAQRQQAQHQQPQHQQTQQQQAQRQQAQHQQAHDAKLKEHRRMLARAYITQEEEKQKQFGEQFYRCERCGI